MDGSGLVCASLVQVSDLITSVPERINKCDFFLDKVNMFLLNLSIS